MRRQNRRPAVDSPLRAQTITTLDGTEQDPVGLCPPNLREGQLVL